MPEKGPENSSEDTQLENEEEIDYHRREKERYEYWNHVWENRVALRDYSEGKYNVEECLYLDEKGNPLIFTVPYYIKRGGRDYDSRPDLIDDAQVSQERAIKALEKGENFHLKQIEKAKAELEKWEEGLKRIQAAKEKLGDQGQ